MSPRIRWRWPSRRRRATGSVRTTLSPSIWLTRKDLHWSTCRGADAPRSSSSAANRSCFLRSSSGREPSCSTPPRTTTKSAVSKIVPNRFSDGDVKINTSLDLADVIRQMANLGASYPEIVSILETANRRHNLVGTLVVDAVPSSSKLYLEAVLGKDTTAKKDDSVKRTSGASKAEEDVRYSDSSAGIRILPPRINPPQIVRVRMQPMFQVRASRPTESVHPTRRLATTPKKAPARRTDRLPSRMPRSRKPRPTTLLPGAGSSTSSEEATNSRALALSLLARYLT